MALHTVKGNIIKVYRIKIIDKLLDKESTIGKFNNLYFIEHTPNSNSFGNRLFFSKISHNIDSNRFNLRY